MKRTPAPDVPRRPSCFGFHHHERLPRCQPCVYAPQCRASTEQWRGYASLSQWRDHLETLIRDETPANDTMSLSDFFKYYPAQYRRQFGCPPWFGGRVPEIAIPKLREAYDWCRLNRVDPATYVVAQFNSMQMWVDGGGFFTAANLVGPRAVERWQKFVCNGQRIVRSVGPRTFENTAVFNQVLEQLTEDATAVSYVYLQLWEPTFTPDIEQCQRTVTLSEWWQDNILTRARLNQIFGSRVKYVRPLVNARAACYHAAEVSFSAPANILVTEAWAWADFCSALRQLTPKPLAPHVSRTHWVPSLKEVHDQ